MSFTHMYCYIIIPLHLIKKNKTPLSFNHRQEVIFYQHMFPLQFLSIVLYLLVLFYHAKLNYEFLLKHEVIQQPASFESHQHNAANTSQ